MIDVINVSSRGQIVIPKKVRKHLNIKEGSKLILLEKDNAIILKKEDEVAEHFLEESRGEEVGWLALAEKNLRHIWDNQKDENVWKRYL